MTQARRGSGFTARPPSGLLELRLHAIVVAGRNSNDEEDACVATFPPIRVSYSGCHPGAGCLAGELCVTAVATVATVATGRGFLCFRRAVPVRAVWSAENDGAGGGAEHVGEERF